MSRQLSVLLVVIAATGCRDSSSTNVDASSHQDAPGGSPDGSSAACTTYTATSISAMRQAPTTGCFELDNVVLIAKTPSTKNPKVFVQDAGGGDFSAIMTKCSTSTTSTHQCPTSPVVSSLVEGHSVTVKGTYIKSKTTKFEEFYIEQIADNGVGTVPAPATVTIADIEKGGNSGASAKYAFEMVSVASASLKMYDFNPTELIPNPPSTSCSTLPYVFGFAMVSSSSSATAPAMCTNNTSEPASGPGTDPTEVLIGTDFYKTFTVSTDCRCNSGTSVPPSTGKQPTSTSTVTGKITGALVFDVPTSGTGYFYFAPKDTNTNDFPITNTVTGP